MYLFIFKDVDNLNQSRFTINNIQPLGGNKNILLQYETINNNRDLSNGPLSVNSSSLNKRMTL